MNYRKDFGKRSAFVVCLLCFTAILSPLSMLESAHGISQSTNVHGIVVDENGVGLSDVKVEVFTLAGDFVTGIKTNWQGEFATPPVEFGTYNLHLNKVGYAEVVKKVTINVFGQRLGETVMSPALSLSASTLSVVTHPGLQVALPFTATYSGEGNEIVEFSVSAPEELSPRLLQGSNEIIQLELTSGQSLSLQIELTVPSTVPHDTSYTVSVTAYGTGQASKNFTVVVRSPIAVDVAVSGKVVDELKLGMAGVTVGVYSSSDTLVKSVVSSSDGSFSVNLLGANTYSLKFSKDGYVPVSTSVTLNATDAEVVLSDTSLAKVLWLTSSISGTTANPGDKLTLPFMLSNVGSTIESVSLSANVPDGWSAKVLDGSNHEITSTALTSSSNVNLQLDVLVPLGAEGDYNLTLAATGKIATTLTFKVHVGLTNDSILFCQFPGKSVSPGEAVKFQMSLTNPFSVPMRFGLSVLDVPANWTVLIKNAGGDYVTEVILGANEVAEVVVELKCPPSTATNKTYDMSFVAEAVNQNVTDSVPVAVTVTELASEIALTVRLPEVAIEAGNSVSYPIAVSNSGVVDRFLLLSIEPPANWKTAFKLGGVEVTKLYLMGGNTSELTVDVTPPSSVALNTYTFPIYLKSESGIILAQANLTTTIVGSYNLGLSLSTYMTTANSGESATFTATVTNMGYTTLTGIRMNITLPVEDWSVSFTPVQVNTLGPRESASFNVVVKTTENTVSGDYMVTVKGESDQMGSGQNQVRLTVSASTSWGLYGIGIAVAFIGLLVVVFWKFKRR
ncbi:MAG: NEW3 domain-containing protein [Candidatus Bathyarchaeota archaeon]|nr:NEW3 domain-containing protein [Candidatus Bathyarchaeota archaeon]